MILLFVGVGIYIKKQQFFSFYEFVLHFVSLTVSSKASTLKAKKLHNIKFNMETRMCQRDNNITVCQYLGYFTNLHKGHVALLIKLSSFLKSASGVQNVIDKVLHKKISKISKMDTSKRYSVIPHSYSLSCPLIEMKYEFYNLIIILILIILFLYIFFFYHVPQIYRNKTT